MVRCVHFVFLLFVRGHMLPKFAIEIDLGVHCSRKGVGSKKNQKVHQLPNFEISPAAYNIELSISKGGTKICFFCFLSTG